MDTDKNKRSLIKAQTTKNSLFDIISKKQSGVGSGEHKEADMNFNQSLTTKNHSRIKFFRACKNGRRPASSGWRWTRHPIPKVRFIWRRRWALTPPRSTVSTCRWICGRWRGVGKPKYPQRRCSRLDGLLLYSRAR